MSEKYTVYYGPSCSWCHRALDLLISSNAHVELKSVSVEEHKAHIVGLGFKTVPQIWHGEKHIGGFEKLVEHMKNG